MRCRAAAAAAAAAGVVSATRQFSLAHSRWTQTSAHIQSNSTPGRKNYVCDYLEASVILYVHAAETVKLHHQKAHRRTTPSSNHRNHVQTRRIGAKDGPRGDEEENEAGCHLLCTKLPHLRRSAQSYSVCAEEAGQYMSGVAGIVFSPSTESFLHQKQYGLTSADSWSHHNACCG
ncbi:Hypothetical predicted protein [Scomber scombrus]|uniref:Secreted protein n=1 Tax=Scomber scombrus TaxID=13677 RepID=A0AAV1NBQ5_SCOSC